MKEARRGSEDAASAARDEQGRPRARGDTSHARGPAAVAGVSITNPDRIVYPDRGFTKADLARYWAAVAGVALPHVVDRPLTVVRCPSGIGEDCFFQKHAAESMPRAVKRVAVPDKSGDPKPEPYMLVEDLPGLISLVQLGVVEFHVWNARSDRLDRPDTLVMDVDPGPDVSWGDTVVAATTIRDQLAEVGLRSWPRATGGKGLHVVVPLVRRHGWADVKAFARGIAELMAATAPDRFVARSSKQARKGKIYVDYLRNDRDATAIATFSPRARPGAPIAHPLTWDALESTADPPHLSIRKAAGLDWVKADPWRGWGDVRQSITRAARERLARR